jgi:hypothetical protein
MRSAVFTMTASDKKLSMFLKTSLLTLFSTSTHVSGFTVRDTFGSSKQNSRLFATSPTNHQRDFDLLIQAATSTSNGCALGGDFAGVAATFDPGDGSFIPIPVHLVPKALIEWGQGPKCLEVLVSEELNGESMARSTITVLPDTGCSIDNLETIKVEDDVDLSSQWGEDTNVVGLQYQTSDDEIRLETIFGMDDGHRMRVAIDLVPSQSVFAIQSPMVLALERRTNSIGTGGTIADGGGLDGRTVFMLLGEKLQKEKTFADEMPLEDCYESNGIKHVSFPGSVSIAYGWLTEEDWVLQVGHIYDGVRRVVSRQFSIIDDGDELDFDVESWEEEVVDIDA